MTQDDYDKLVQVGHDLLDFICKKYGDVFCEDDWKCPIHKELAKQIGFTNYPERPTDEWRRTDSTR